MNNKALLITSALVLGSSSLAMADSFSFGGRASVSVSVGSRGPVVRDHRAPVYQPIRNRPAYQTPAYTTVNYDNVRWQEPQRPVVIPTNLDCRNWDPTIDANDACAVYSSGYTYAPQTRGWALLGVRESAVPVGQFITVDDGRIFNQLTVRAEQGSPVITKIAISFMDGSAPQVTTLGGCMETGNSLTINMSRRAVNQIVIYTANGSHGTYSIAAR